MATTATPTGGATAQTLSSWAGPYVTDVLGRANAIGNEAYQTYGGPLTAGASPLQNQAFQTAGGLQAPTSMETAATGAQNLQGYTPTQFNGGIFDTQAAQQYMNPYLQQALNPQLDEARRQSQITQLGNNAKFTQAGAFGGSRQALADTETQRNLGTNLANITGQGYNTAYNNAQQQFNADMGRSLTAQAGTEQSKQFGARQGIDNLTAQANIGNMLNSANLQNLQAQLTAGQQQRGIEQEGIAADYNEFLNQREDPMKKTQFMHSMLNGLPISTVASTGAPMSNAAAVAGGATSANEILKALGLA